MTPERLAATIKAVVQSLVDSGELALDEVPDVVIERPKNREHGDYATNAALSLAKRAGMSSRDLALMIARELAGAPGVKSAEVAGPGFINFRIEAAAAGELAKSIVTAGADYGRGASLAGQKVNVEFISANPTGPLHLGHTRWAAVGDAIARVLDAAGADVAREFYINDRGVQIDLFGESISAAAAGEPAPRDGYLGGYVTDLAAQILADHPEFASLPGEERRIAFREEGYSRQLRQHKDVLHLFRTDFDVWYSERSLHESGAVERAMAKLKDEGYVYEADGAVWLRTTAFDDDKDRVLIKADGELTYFASDAAYYVDKRDRGFDVSIYLLGADHHGYVNRLRAVAACAGDDPDKNIEVLIGQLVRMVRGGEEVIMSKRAGRMLTLEDLVDEVGVDAARYSLIRYPCDSPLTLDLELMVQRTNDNPVFYVQYAHARISSVLRNAAQLGIDWRSVGFDPSLLTDERESVLLGVLAELPRVVASAAELREPHRVARYLENVASAYHKFYDSCRVLPLGQAPVEPINISRLWLCAAARQVIANGLELCGVNAPERM
ncbi:MAG: arginine--tRNA ligase [Candidatus Nanopelagicales bacterium]|nr:arginine--tRNA ligase [Candidatus Nanopelagicales bacterium]MDZ4249131.1 arginine--tRNA ligase [Candidatus Nanopelagicales bacterium]